jgi:protocatechuate 3,4-dioxygenase beta subunit
MKTDALERWNRINRRQTLLVLGGAGASLLSLGSAPSRAQTAFDCVLSPEMTEGPYWVDEDLNRSDIRANSESGAAKAGALLTLSITVHSVTSTACGLLPGAQVDIWHCDAGGLYSDVSANNTVGQNFPARIPDHR